MKIRTHKELRVWQEAMDLAMEVFVLSKGFPADERFSLTDQVRRASRSVAANLSEAWRKRRYAAAFVSKLNDAEGEAAETQTHLEIARSCGYVTEASARQLDERYEALLAQMVSMASRPEVWTVAPRGDKETGGQRGGETGGQRDRETGGQGDKGTVRVAVSPSLIVPKSQSLPIPVSPSPKVARSQSPSP